MKNILSILILILFVGILTPSSAQINIIPDSATICIGGSIQLNINIDSLQLSACGQSTSICTGSSIEDTIGIASGANTNTSWPAPYGNWYSNAKHQFLFTANELNALGIYNGKITEIAWEVTQLQSMTPSGNQGLYHNYTISMGCTSASSILTFETGLTSIYGPIDYSVTLGWNIHTFNNPYEWDGSSNLIVQICYDWLTPNTYSDNCITPWTTTTFNSCMYTYSDPNLVCPDSTGLISSNRPITKFTYCSTIPDSNNYTYSWTPTQGLSNPNIPNPIASPTTTTTYYATVTDSLGNSSTDSILIIVNICTYINESGLDFNISIYPNPNNGNFTITKPNELNKDLEYKLFNALGKLIIDKTIPKNQNSTEINISKQNNGLYFIHLKIGDQLFIKKVLKN